MTSFTRSGSAASNFTLVAGSLSVFAYVYLALSSQKYGDANLVQLLSVSLFCATLSIAVWARHNYTEMEVSIPLMLGFALLFRLIGLTAFPILEDDIYRYLWDGRMTVELGSPYSAAPSKFFEADFSERFEHILGLINYPDIATIYGPVCQWVFALSYLISPGAIWPLQLMFGLADMALILVLLQLTKMGLATPNAVLLYAWCPLIIKEFAFTAHPDVLGALFLVLAYLCFRKRLFVWVGIFMACATGVKVFALIMLPFLLGLSWRGWVAFAVTAMLLALPFSAGGTNMVDAWLPDGLRAMGGHWLFNAPLYEILTPMLSIQTVKLVLLTMLALGCLVYLLRTLRQWPQSHIRGDFLFGALFICAPALNPWYLVWLLPFATIRPSLWAWTASISLLFSYASGINLANSGLGLGLQSYQIPDWVLLVEFGLIAIALAVTVLKAATVSQRG